MSTAAIEPAASDAQVMQCMEVWGGNQAVDCGVIMAGLDAWLYSRPLHSERGGDVHYVSSCALGQVTRMMVADVSGHGEAVADAAGRLRHLMRRYVNHLDQTRFVAALNREFATIPGQKRFATSVVGTYYAPTSNLVVSNAGHPPPFVYRRRDSSWSSVEPLKRHDDVIGDVPLGILEESPYGKRDVPLRVGDMVLCYTDSLIEARDRDGRMLGTDGLRALVQKQDAARPQALIASLLAEIASLHAGNLDADDVTVLLFRANGLAPRPPLWRKLKAPFVLLGCVVKSLRPGGEPVPWPEFSWANLGGGFFNRFHGKGAQDQ
jgi:hypothetical protein